MGYLIVEMLVCLLVAALIGVFFGWLLGRLRGRGETDRAVEALQGELQAMRTSHQQTRLTLEAAESRLAGLEGFSGQVSDLERRSHDIDVATAGLQAALDDQSALVASFQPELAGRDRRLQQLQDQVHELAQLSIRVAEQSETLDRLTGETRTGLARLPKLAGEVAELRGLREVAANHEAALAAVAPAFAERDGRIDGLEEAVARSRQDEAALLAKWEETAASVGRLEEQGRRIAESVSQRFDEGDVRFRDLSSKVAAQHEVDEDLRGRLEGEARRLVERDRRIAELEPRVEAVEAITPRVESLGGRVGEAVRRLEEQTGLLTSMPIELSRRDERLDQVESALERQKATLEPLTARLGEGEQRDVRIVERLHRVESALEEVGAARQGLEEVRREISDMRVSFHHELSEHAKQPHGAPAAPPEPPKPDDLTKIWGVGKVLESRLNKLGIYTFAQIAALSKAEIDQVQEGLDTIPDRIEREEWVEQARRLANAANAQAATASVH